MIKYAELSFENGRVVEKSVREIPQESLTSDCWMVQFRGLSACKSCNLKNTRNCGGGETLKNIKKAEKGGLI